MASEETDEALSKILTDAQTARYRQLVWQALEASEGPLRLAANPVAAKTIGFTGDQRELIDGWIKELEAARSAQRQEPAKAREKMNSLNEKVVAALTAGQKSKWNELLGEPFKGRDIILQPGMRPLKFPEPKK